MRTLQAIQNKNQNTKRFFAAAFLTAIAVAAGSAPAQAMGRAEEPAPQPVGTEADPAIRASEQNLQQLLFHPDRTGQPASTQAQADPADAKISPDR